MILPDRIDAVSSWAGRSFSGFPVTATIPPGYCFAVFFRIRCFIVGFGRGIDPCFDFILNVPEAPLEFRNAFTHALGNIGNAFGPEEQ